LSALQSGSNGSGWLPGSPSPLNAQIFEQELQLFPVLQSIKQFATVSLALQTPSPQLKE